MDEEQGSIYARFWDHYIENAWDHVREHTDRDDVEWPGDEWLRPPGWERLFQRLFVPAGVESWRRAVEVGAGSGKYTLKVIGAAPEIHVRAYDVSRRFLEVCAERCAAEIERDQLSLHLIDVNSPDHMLQDLTTSGWRREVDCFYSIDAMVHVDLQYVIAYLMTAALTLKTKGKLILTMANVGGNSGFKRLLKGLDQDWASQTSPIGSSKMEWVNPAIMESVLTRLGFELELMNAPTERWWLELVASLEHPQVAEELEEYLGV